MQFNNIKSGEYYVAHYSEEVEPTLEEFLDYIVDKKSCISNTFTQDSEYNELLIKLLKNE